MIKAKWRRMILEQMEQIGVSKSAYDSVVETLAAILEERDRVAKVYKAAGSNPVTEYTNKSGASNWVKNPMIVLWDDLNKSALAYWRELGLTPAAYKKMAGEGPKQEGRSALAEALRSLDAD